MLYLVLFIFLTLVSQVLLKMASLKKAGNGARVYIFQMIKSPMVILAYSLSFINIFIWIMVLTKMTLLIAFLSASSLYVLIIIADYIFFKEKINLFKIAGACFISIGIILSFI